ncbi:type II toxin-antitoxin system RelE family toxin [Pectobacterium colocasium]|uniref:type II toxin-antitoxin system RelE family toxin n=1 Tax=Pectobacterium colocasium TaxID=2878098 RepID=UPI003B27D4BD
MSYKLEFEEHALKEFKKLGAPVREHFTKTLKEVLQHPHVPANRLHGWLTATRS